MAVIEEVTSETALTLKERGNELFKAKQYGAAASVYSEALALECSDDLKATLLLNRGTCNFHLSKYSDCVSDCSAALQLNPQYVKAYYRRALAHEKLDQLDEAVANFDEFFKLDSSMRTIHLSHYTQLTERRNAKFEKEKEEMMSSLKSLGNSLLGNFGLSLDQFKFDKDPSTGNYSVRMDSAS